MQRLKMTFIFSSVEFPTVEAIPLANLPPGTPARLCAPQQGAFIPPRLQDLGFVPGTPLTLVRRAPLGDPVSALNSVVLPVLGDPTRARRSGTSCSASAAFIEAAFRRSCRR